MSSGWRWLFQGLLWTCRPGLWVSCRQGAGRSMCRQQVVSTRGEKLPGTKTEMAMLKYPECEWINMDDGNNGNQ